MEGNSDSINKSMHLQSADFQQRCQKHTGERTVSLINGAEKVGYPYIQKNKTFISDHILKITSKWIKDLNIRRETMERVEANIQGTFYEISIGNIFCLFMFWGSY
jgi:hypothetical protein